MMKNLFFKSFLTIIFCIALFNPIYGYFVSGSLWGKEDKRILVLGDCHVHGEANERDKSLLTAFFNKLETIDQKSYFILESNCAILEECKNDLSLLIAYAGKYAEEHQLDESSLEFLFSDFRKTALRQLLDSYEEVRRSMNIFANVSSEVLFGAKGGFYHMADNMNIKMLKRPNISTCQNILNEIKEVLKKADDPSLIMLKDKNFKDIENPLISLKEKIKSAYDGIQGFFRKYSIDANDSSTGMFLNAINSMKTFEPIKEFQEYYSIILDDLPDVGFIYSLKKACDRYDNIIIYVGNYHTISINNFIRYLGYTPVVPQIGSYEKEIIEQQSISPLEEQNLEMIFNKFIEKKEKQCAGCLNYRESLLRCGNCKKINYCDKTCQRKHWMLGHKIECKKLMSCSKSFSA